MQPLKRYHNGSHSQRTTCAVRRHLRLFLTDSSTPTRCFLSRRQPYIVHAGNITDLLPHMSYISNNFLINNYHSTWPIDHDDGKKYDVLACCCDAYPTSPWYAVLHGYCSPHFVLPYELRGLLF